MSNFTTCQRRLIKDLQKIQTEDLPGSLTDDLKLSFALFF
jgi:hypothetical protein